MSLMLRRYVHACAGLNATNVTVPLGTPNPMVFPNLYHLISRLSRRHRQSLLRMLQTYRDRPCDTGPSH